MYLKASPNRAGRRTRWMLRQAPQTDEEARQRGYTSRRLTPEEIARIAAEMNLSVSPPKPGSAR
jgi:hypothetical protein